MPTAAKVFRVEGRFGDGGVVSTIVVARRASSAAAEFFNLNSMFAKEAINVYEVEAGPDGSFDLDNPVGERFIRSFFRTEVIS